MTSGSSGYDGIYRRGWWISGSISVVYGSRPVVYLRVRAYNPPVLGSVAIPCPSCRGSCRRPIRHHRTVVNPATSCRRPTRTTEQLSTPPPTHTCRSDSPGEQNNNRNNSDYHYCLPLLLSICDSSFSTVNLSYPPMTEW